MPVHDHVVERAVVDGAGQSGARLRLDAALGAAEDCQVAGLQVARASWRDEAQHDVSERRLHGGQGGLAGVDARAMACPAAVSGYRAGAPGGGGCAPEEHVPSAAANWGVRRTAAVLLVANSDQQTGRWRPARSAMRKSTC